MQVNSKSNFVNKANSDELCTAVSSGNLSKLLKLLSSGSYTEESNSVPLT